MFLQPPRFSHNAAAFARTAPHVAGTLRAVRTHEAVLTVHDARAALEGLAKKGYAFERLGHEGYDGDREVPRGRYIITEEGRRAARRLE